jgi:hypothetical protein
MKLYSLAENVLDIFWSTWLELTYPTRQPASRRGNTVQVPGCPGIFQNVFVSLRVIPATNSFYGAGFSLD